MLSSSTAAARIWRIITEHRPSRYIQYRKNLELQQIIVRSGLFDPQYYLATNLDVALAGIDPLLHYVEYGRHEGRRPSLDFDPRHYLAANPDVQSAGAEPVLHYIRNGRSEGRSCRGPGLTNRDLPGALLRLRSSGLFSDEFYFRQCPAVAKAGIDPLLHYAVEGFIHHVESSPAFSMRAYSFAHREAWVSGLNPMLHMLNSGWDRDIACSPNAIARLSEAGTHHCRPDDPVGIERMAGVAYFHRFLFGFDATESPGIYSTDAIAEMVCLTPELKLERIEPQVSIVIPVYGQLHFVLACLDSLRRQRSRFTTEIIIVDDASPAATEIRRLAAIPWVRYRRREHNGGFVDSCNEGATMARGRFIVFLNSDTRVAQGWLDELIGSFQLFPKAGLVGSKLFNEDGSLQEAGGIYWRDGSAWNYGRNDDPNHPKYCFARQVDYVSAAAVAFPAEVWRLMHGFDTSYRPAYCEDADLAFRLRHAGYQVWLQPSACVIHYEGKTHGRDITKGVKAYQASNGRRFAARWKPTLDTFRPNGERPDREANRHAKDRILVLDACTPTPDRDSGSFITFRMLRAFQSLGYEVTFVPQHNYAYDRPYTDALQRLGIECLYFPYFRSISEVLDFRSDFDVVLVYRFNVLAQVHDEICQRLPGARILFHNVDLHFLREERQAALLGSRSKKIAAALTRAAELQLIAKVDCNIVHTPVEAAIIRQHLPVDNIVEFPYIAELHPTTVAFDDRHDVMFLGGFGHTPNIDAVLHFVSEIWPTLILRLPPQARFLVVGSFPPPQIQDLSGDRVVVTGYVEHLQQYFDSARVFVAPLRYGAGIKGKVIQSLCHGTPAVISVIAAEGIGLVSGQQALVAKNDSDFVESVVRSYFDRSLWQLLQTNGYKFVEEHYGWEMCLDLCRKVLDAGDATWLARHERKLQARLDHLLRESGAASLLPGGNNNSIGAY